MPLLEEVDESPGGSPRDAESLKAEHRRKRAKASASKSRKKKRAEGSYVSAMSVLGVLAPAVVVVAAGLWAKSSAMDRKSNSCKMTMSRPEYVRLPVAGYPDTAEDDAAGESPGYGYRLLRYMDRRLPASDRFDASKPGGVPVLFVPGHLGSFKQVRSLGSHAAEAKVLRQARRLDIFALDLLEEWTALHGSMVWRQAEFLNHAVEAVLALYERGKASSSPTSVMVVGHSLGGLVARAAFTLPSYRPGSITDILTLGTPHDRAPWMMDYSTMSLYHCTDSLWRRHSSSPSRSAFSHCWTHSGPADVQTAPSADVNHGGEADATVEARHEETLTLPSNDDDEERKACPASDDLKAPAEDCAAPPPIDTETTEPETTESENAESETAESETAESEAAVAPVAGWGGPAGVDAESLLEDTVLLSVSGGPEDLMVHPSLCVTDGLGLEGQSVGLTTAAVEGCGFGVDHLALVWCKQLASRVVTALSELEKLHSTGAGAKERTRAAARVLSASHRPSTKAATRRVKSVNTSSSDDQSPQSLGFDEAAEAGEAWVVVARSLVTDRSYLLIPAWVLMAALVLATALTRGLSSKTPKEGLLPPVPLLLLPATHLQWTAVKTTSHSVWSGARSRGTLAVVALAASSGALALWAFGDEVAALGDMVATRFPSVVALRSVRGLSTVSTVGSVVIRWAGGTAGGVVRIVNPFEGARDALRLHPAKGILGVYCVTSGLMMLLVYLLAVLGAAGNALLRPIPGVRRLLRSRRVAVVFFCAAVLAAHVEEFSLPPRFRPLSLRGELSLVFLGMSLLLYALLASLALMPASSPVASAYQRLVFLIYTPAPAVLIGPQLAAAGVLFRKAGTPHESFVACGELVLACLALAPIIASVCFARRGRPFPSPPSIRGVLAELKEQMDEEVARANGGSTHGAHGHSAAANGNYAAGVGSPAQVAAAALERPHGHGACGKCFHADGGQGSIFVETDQERVSVGAGVSLGPGFRVVACDCPLRERATPSSWCDFCRCVCEACGGCKEAVRAMRGASRGGWGAGSGQETRSSSILGAASSLGLASAAVLYFGLWKFGMRVMAAPCHSLGALAVMGVVLCSMHCGLARDASMGLGRS